MKPVVIYPLSVIFSVAAATNIIAYTKGGCSSAYAQCGNIAQRTCCEVVVGTQGAVSAQFQNLPGPSNLYGYQNTRSGGQCGALDTTNNVSGGSWCITPNPSTQGQYAGLAYATTSSKRDLINVESTKCTSSVAADTFVLEDGTKFDLTAMTLEDGRELWQLGADGATKDSLPKKFLQYAIGSTSAQITRMG